ncbi:MAG: amidophosphoribosyltransferase [Paludibacteraceae bacterium]|nr:amidophosphoribosyltransferase [Paludibacteraceae bacterium]
MEPLKHECGVAMVRLRKPLTYYQHTYGTWQYGLNKLYLMMEKQHNRGQEAAGLACLKMKAEAGEEYFFRERALGSQAITEIFANVHHRFADFDAHQLQNADFAERYIPYAGEIYMGHLRYSTTGKSGMSFVHPFLRRNNWRARNLCICGNFNMTNMDEVFSCLTTIGQHPRLNADTYVMLEQLGHRLDRESDRLYEMAKQQGLSGMHITEFIEHHIDISHVLEQSVSVWDGGYVLCGITGSGECFSMRDPWGIRPAFWYADDEVMVLASERPVIQTAFNLSVDDIHELQPGQAILMNQAGEMRLQQILPPAENQACSFERIYFSRGSDSDIYRERKALGRQLVEPILQAVDYDVDHTVFSYIPNTAEVAFYGMTEGFDYYKNQQRIQRILDLQHAPSADELRDIFGDHVRREKVAWKDIKLRTFITESKSRNDLAAHVYDITYGCLNENIDNLVIIDDSIVRGTTLRESIIRILDRLHPKKLVIVSSAPQIRYPDYYGIDMSHMSEFIAFQATIALLIEKGMLAHIKQVYVNCMQQLLLPKEQMVNAVKQIYEPFTDQQIADKMVELLRVPTVKTDIQLVFQTLDGLHHACPNHPGDWYFSGNYPTMGGVRKVNQAFIDYIQESQILNQPLSICEK